jgi:hypothetical protein
MKPWDHSGADLKLESPGYEARVPATHIFHEVPFKTSDFLRLRHSLGPPLLSSGESSWLQIQRSGFDSRRYQIF